MKLRNKKTGEIFYPDDWEAFEPTEPLIKDEKIRKAVRAWADANDIEPGETVLITKPTFDGRFLDVEHGMLTVSFIYDDESIAHNSYTIAELCGKEEAPEPIEPTFVDLDERIKEKEEE